VCTAAARVAMAANTSAVAATTAGNERFIVILLPCDTARAPR
jgi:hypothetical protein